MTDDLFTNLPDVDWGVASGIKPAPVANARKADEDGQDVPPGLTRKVLSLRTAMLRYAKDVTEHLPGPGESLHALMTGRYDLTVLLVALIEKVGHAVNHLRIATLSFSDRNTSELFHLIDRGIVKRLSLLASEFMADNCRPSWQDMAQGLLDRGPQHRIRADRTHAKIVCLEFDGGGKMVLEGSANLRTNGNVEQVTIIRDDGLHDHFAAWIDERMGDGEKSDRA